jgi:alcohol dehydrogenase, propanol-preferring
MRAMTIGRIGPVSEGSSPLDRAELPVPSAGNGEVLIRVSVCGVCHTELDEIEGRTPPPRLPVIPGHQVVGRVEKCGAGARIFAPGDRVGVGWIFSACGTCPACRRGNENLCPDFCATGRDVNGGYAEYMTVSESFAHPLPTTISDAEAAPLLCAGAIGYRSLQLTGLTDGRTLGLVGFGASAHLVLKLARHLYPRSRISVFSRSASEREFGLELGAAWAGAIGDRPPGKLDCIIDTTPAWKPVVESLQCLAPGGRLVINAIRKESADREELLRLDYPRHLWQEKEIKSVANVTRRDIRAFLSLAAEAELKPEVQQYRLEDANTVLLDLRKGRVRGAKILTILDSER